MLGRLTAWCALAAALLWAYWPTLRDMAGRWSADPQYSHGYLVPLFALVLFWARRSQRAAVALRPSWWGVALFGAAGGMRIAGWLWSLAAAAVGDSGPAAWMLRAGGRFVSYDWIDALSLIVAVAALFVLCGGWRALRWAGPALAFLLFMLPLPYRFEIALARPLQSLATLLSTYALQTLGYPAFAEGNVILLNDVRIGVALACSGLSMLMTFFALATAVALLVERRLLDKILIVLSAAPIALVTNVARITLTGILHDAVGKELADAVFHHFAGWLMMPVALGLLWIELRVLGRLLQEPDKRTEGDRPCRELRFCSEQR